MNDGLIFAIAMLSYGAVGAVGQTISENRKRKKEIEKRFQEIKRANRLRKIRGGYYGE